MRSFVVIVGIILCYPEKKYIILIYSYTSPHELISSSLTLWVYFYSNIKLTYNLLCDEASTA